MSLPAANDVGTNDTVIPSRIAHQMASTLAPLIGDSKWHRELLQRLDLLAHDARPVAIVGAAGVGKTLTAKHLHWRSAAATAPCECIDLRRFPAEIVETELFGYARGGFFQRSGHVPGLIAGIGEGTCILQGIEQLPAEVQERFIPWFTEQSATPVGTDTAEHLPARIVVELRLPTFPRPKESPVIPALYDILRQSVVEVAPLAERRDDIQPIAEYYLTTYAATWGLPSRRFSQEAGRLLRRGAWRENVRGLISAIAGTVMGVSAETVEAHHLPPWIAGRVTEVTSLGLEGVALEELVAQKLTTFFERLGRYEVHDVYDTVMQKVERPLLRLVMERTGGNQLRAARILGINRNTLRARLKELGLK